MLQSFKIGNFQCEIPLRFPVLRETLRVKQCITEISSRFPFFIIKTGENKKVDVVTQKNETCPVLKLCIELI